MKKLSILLLAIVALLFVGMYNAPTAQAAETNVSFDVTVVEDGDIVTLPALTGQYGKNMSFDAGGLLVENMEFAYHILNGKVIESPTHNVLVSGSSNLIVVIQSVGTTVTTFIDVNGKLLDANTTGQAPLNVPLKPGFDFDGFVDLEGTDKPVKVATYTRKTDVATIAVTVNGGSKDLVDVKYNDVVTLQPADMDNFKYWADANGKFVSSKPNYKFTALKNVTFEAVTVGDIPLLTSVYMTSVDIRDGHESYLAQIELKEGESLLEYGYLISETEMGDIVVGAPGVEKVSSTALNPLTNEFLMSFPLVKFLNIRAYALVDNGTTQTYVYNELPGSFASDLFISEYIEGSSNNKALEIYNGTGQTVDLTNYSIGLYANGDLVGLFSSLSGTLAHGETYVISNSLSNQDILSVSDREYSYVSGSFGANWNGDDAVALLKNENVIDLIGVIGVQPSKSWPVGTGATAEYTLVRKSSVISPTSTWDTSEWDVYPQDTTTYLGSHAHVGGTLTLSDSQSILIDAISIPEFADIKADGSIELPSTGANGTTITWSSSDPSIINVDTKEVNIPLETQESVILTATISKGGLSKTVDREVMVGLSDEDREALENNIITQINNLYSGKSFDESTPANLPSELMGVSITWSYNPSDLIIDGSFKEVEEDLVNATITASFTVTGRDNKVHPVNITVTNKSETGSIVLLESDFGSTNDSTNTSYGNYFQDSVDKVGGGSSTYYRAGGNYNGSSWDYLALGQKSVNARLGDLTSNSTVGSGVNTTDPNVMLATGFTLKGVTSIVVKMPLLKAGTTIHLQTSSDGINWTNLSSINPSAISSMTDVTFDNISVTGQVYYRFAFVNSSSTSSNGWLGRIKTITFNGNSPPVTNPTEDNESPIITLEPGVSPVRLSVGDSWTLPTATAVDNVDGAISFIDVDTTLINQFYNSSTSQYIFTSTGTYEVEFTAADESGNITTKVITIIVSDGVDGYTGYYESINGLSGQPLLYELGNIISVFTPKSYDSARDILQESDEDPNNPNNIILIYNRASVVSTWDGGDTWNREHVWPQSYLDGASASDLHNLKPASNSINSSRGNTPFRDSVNSNYGHVTNGWFPGDDDKGDVARILFYMVTRYSQLNISTMGVLSTLLEWHIEDPVDDFERNRNEVLYSYQKNRNPYIDHPELVDLVW